MSQPAALAAVGRYVLHDAIARGGMATVHAARFIAAESVSRLVAAKRLHPHFTDDPEFVAMFHDEARIASRIHHPNVVPVLDVILEGDEVILVQEYVHGVPLSHLFKLAVANEKPIPTAIVVTILAGVLAGLHAAHEATDDVGEPLGVVHRDVSPQNVLVSVDGIPRLVDFGIAKAKTSVHHTREGFFKGKLAYMAPEQLRSEPVTRQADIYAAGVLLWELIVNRRYYDGSNDLDFVRSVAFGDTPPPTQVLGADRASFSDERWADLLSLEAIVMRATASEPAGRYATAVEMATALLAASPSATAADVAAWVRVQGQDYLEKRQQILASNDESWRGSSSSSVRNTEPPSVRDDRYRSGARMRLPPGPDEVTATPHTGRSSGPASIATMAAELEGLRPRSVLPWVVVAGLLLVIGVLAGIGWSRDAMSGPHEKDGAPKAAPSPNAMASAGPAVINVPEVVASSPQVPAPPPTTVRSSTPTRAPSPPQPFPVFRAVAPAPQRAPVAAAAPSSAPSSSTRAECNPPFYFDGTKKVFKPACL